MCLCYTRGERKGERRGGREQLFRHSVDLLPKIAKGVALRAMRGMERVGREGGGVLSLHKACKHKATGLVERVCIMYMYNARLIL